MVSAIYQQEQRAYWAVICIVDLSRDQQFCRINGTTFSEKDRILLVYYQKIYYDAIHRLSFLYGLSTKKTNREFFKKYPELRKL